MTLSSQHRLVNQEIIIEKSEPEINEKQKDADKIFEKSDHDLSPHSQRNQIISFDMIQENNQDPEND